VTDAGECHLRAASSEIAVEHRITSPLAAETVLLPVSALDVWAGRGSDAIDFTPQGERAVLATWSDHGVPRQASYQVGANAKVEFVELPANFTMNEAQLWPALRDAVATTDRNATRYALNCLHLRGKLGRIDATDGRHILSQTGFEFGFEDDLLVPGHAILGCRELDRGHGVAVGRTEDWIGFGVGRSLVMLRVQKEGRFPRIDELLPSTEQALSRLELSAHDAQFLADVIPRLPSNDPQHDPITIDLNGKVLIRSRDVEQPRPTEVELSSSRLIGEPVVLSTDRRYVVRAVQLGFRETFIYGPKAPVLCCDDRRRFLWALLDGDSAIPRSDDVIRIESSAAGSKSPPRHPPEPIMPTEHPRTATTTESVKPVHRIRRPHRQANAGPIDQAIALRDALRQTTAAASLLVRSLKQHQRQNRIVQTTLESLKQLQKVAG